MFLSTKHTFLMIITGIENGHDILSILTYTIDLDTVKPQYFKFNRPQKILWVSKTSK